MYLNEISVPGILLISDIKHYISALLKCTNEDRIVMKRSEKYYSETGATESSKTTTINEFYSLGYSAVHREANCSACELLHSRLLLGLVFDPETGGGMFLRNAG